MSSLSAQIFAADDIESETIEVPQWGVTLLIKSMSAKARALMVDNAMANNGGVFNIQQVMPDIVIQCTFDPETGERVFLDTDREALMAKSANAVEIVATVAMRLSGMTDEAVEAAGKEYSPTQSDASSLS
jgi:hypothetical protein